MLKTSLTNLPPSCADHLEILGASTSWSPKDLLMPVMEWVKNLLTAICEPQWFYNIGPYQTVKRR